jgi:hypothetical protein
MRDLQILRHQTHQVSYLHPLITSQFIIEPEQSKGVIPVMQERAMMEQAITSIEIIMTRGKVTETHKRTTINPNHMEEIIIATPDETGNKTTQVDKETQMMDVHLAHYVKTTHPPVAAASAENSHALYATAIHPCHIVKGVGEIHAKCASEIHP